MKRDADDDGPLTAVALRERLQVHAAAVAAVADEWAVRDAPVSFKDVERALREVVFAFARIAIMLFLANPRTRDARFGVEVGASGWATRQF